MLNTTAIIENDKLPAVEAVRLKAQKRSTNITKKNSGRSKPIQSETLEPAVNHKKNNVSQKKWPVTDEVPEYVIHTGEIAFEMTQPETEILRKVRL